MINQSLVALTNSVLGSGKATARGNYAYHCPLCHHTKPKLEVNFNESSPHYQSYACWVCGFKGRTISSLFKSIKANPEKFTELKSLVKSFNHIRETQVVDSITLPNEFICLNNVDNSDLMSRHALAYLKNRHVSKYDILKYNIGYCKTGLYKNMIIIPTYDANGKLNYFTARSFEKNPYIKYRNPSLSRDIIPNEHLINWNIPLILCEGLFDAIAIKRNAIPLLGKNIQSNLMKKIVTSLVDKIYIALDRDAIKQALRFCEMLLAEGKEVYLVDLQDKDPGEMGFENFTKLIQNTVPLTYYDLMEQKLAI